MRCMICAKTSQETPLERVNDFGVTGVWTCYPHAAKSLHTFAAAKGVEAVRPDLRETAERSLQKIRAT